MLRPATWGRWPAVRERGASGACQRPRAPRWGRDGAQSSGARPGDRQEPLYGSCRWEAGLRRGGGPRPGTGGSSGKRSGALPGGRQTICDSSAWNSKWSSGIYRHSPGQDGQDLKIIAYFEEKSKFGQSGGKFLTGWGDLLHFRRFTQRFVRPRERMWYDIASYGGKRLY